MLTILSKKLGCQMIPKQHYQQGKRKKYSFRNYILEHLT